jgi:hypothetical protein
MDDEGKSTADRLGMIVCAAWAKFSVDLLNHPHRYIRAPSPPPSSAFRLSPLGYVHHHPDREELDIIRGTESEALDHHSRPIAPMTRWRSGDRHEPAARPPVPRSGDEVIEIQPHKAMPTEDYDWYDRNGMRVRVREI